MNKAVNDFIELGRKFGIEYNDKETFVKKTLARIQANNRPAIHLRELRAKQREDLIDFNNCYLKGISYDGVGGGTPKDSWKPNNEEIRQIEFFKLRDKLAETYNKSQQCEKSLERQNKAFESLLNELPSYSYRETMRLMYIDCYSVGKIAELLNYSVESINSHRKRAIKDIVNLI